MQTQFQTEETQALNYTPSIFTPAELADAATTTEADAKTEEVEAAQSVHQWLTNIQRQVDREKKRFWSIFIILELAGILPMLLLPQFVPFSINNHINLVALALPFLPAVGMLLMVLRFFLVKPYWNVNDLVHRGGVQAVGTLIDLINAPKRPRQLTPLYIALTELLPHMKASDAALLTPEQRRLLYWFLKNGLNTIVKPAVYLNFRLAILQALEQIGDAAAIPVVTQLAKGRAHTAGQKTLQAAAQACLPLLQSSFGDVEATETLLRASQSEPTSPEMLLRSVEFTPEAKPQQLLRPAEAAIPLPPVS